jgi:acyl carrier protein
MVTVHYNHQDLLNFEKVLEGCHPGLIAGGTAVFTLKLDQDERLAVISEVSPETPGPELDEIVNAIQLVAQVQRQSIYVIALIREGTLPRTLSGKIQRDETRDELLSGRLEVLKIFRFNDAVSEANHQSGSVPLRTSVEIVLTGIWADVLNVEPISVNDNFFDLGGDSLDGMQILNRVQDVFHVKLTLTALLARPTISVMARLIDEIRSNPDQELIK